MNDETLKEQIDEILNDLANVASGFIIVPEPRNQKDKAKQAILDWHNKQIEAVLDRLRLYAVYGEYDKAEDNSKQGEVVPVMVIEAERNKLKESTDD